MFHDLITHGKPNPEKVIEYNPQTEMTMDILMSGINTKVTAEGDNCGQQYILHKGLNKYK